MTMTSHDHTNAHDRLTRSHRRTVLAGSFLLVLLVAGLSVRGVPAASPAGPKAYIGLFKDNAVAVLDTTTNRVLATIPVPPGPHGVVVTPDGRKVYVSSDGDSTVSVIDSATDRVVRQIDVGPTPHGLALSPDGRELLVAGFGANQAVLIDTATDQVAGRIPVPQPHNSAISPDGRTAYVASQQQGDTALVILDLAGRTRLGKVALDRTPRALDWSPNGRWLYFTVAGVDAVQVLDPATQKVVGQIPVGASPHYAQFTTGSQLSLVVSQGPGELAIVDPGRSAVSASIGVGKAPHWVAASADGRTAYVTNEVSGDVSVVDLVGRRVIATVPVGQAPRKIAVQPGPGVTATSPATGGASPAPTSGGQATAAGGVAFSDHGTKTVRGQARLELEADDYYFKPTFLRGVPGQALRLEIENESGTLHNLSIPALRIDRDVPPRGTVAVDVIFPASGSLRFYCKFHAALGMNGELRTGEP
jgi:YVTN family beta-propeller protein